MNDASTTVDAAVAEPLPVRDSQSGRVWILFGAGALVFATVLGVVGAWVTTPDGGSTEAIIENLVFTFVNLLPILCGCLILRAQPRNVVGWLLLVQGFAFAMMGWTDMLVENALDGDHTRDLGARLAVLWGQDFWPLLFAGFAAIAYLYPDGHTFNRKYRRWGVAGLVALTSMLLIAVINPHHFEGKYAEFSNPLAVLPFEIPQALMLLFFFAGFASLIAAAFAVRARLRASTGERRLQMLWLAWAALAIPGTLFLCILDGLIFNTSGGPLTVLGLAMMATLMPSAIAIGILRYRVFDIEVVINRTLVYGSLSLIVGAIYAGIVAGFGALIGSSTAAGVIGAGVVAVIVQPVYARLHRRIDRMVYGDRSDPYAALQRLDERLKETQAPGDVVQAVVDSVAESLRLPWSAVEFERDGAGMTIAAHGIRGRGSLERRELWHRGESVGSLAVEVPRGRPLTESDGRLLDQLASHVGAAVQSVRLTIDLQESRKELITAREEERRRLRRDLHDGVGPSLAAMSMQLEVLRDRVDDDDTALVEQLGGQVQEAITDIRRLVYELRPPALDQYGLVSAITEQAGRMSNGASSFSVTASDDLPQLSAAVEVAVYRIALEGMTNAARHSGSRSCDVSIAVDDAIVVVVEDDGVGVDNEARQGVGLRSMRERTAELGGEFAITQREGGGTVVRASFPLEDV